MKVAIPFLLCSLSLLTFTLCNACPVGCTCAEHRVRCYGLQLREIPAYIPPDTTHLDLESNQINVVDNRRISHLAELTELLLGYNHIVEVQAGVFVGLTKLVVLNMDSNTLTSLHVGAFDGLRNLNSLYLTNNNISSVTGVFRNLTSLKRMDVGGNGIEKLNAQTFEDLKNLIYLMMPDNRINSVSANTFVPLQSLSHVVLKNNPLNIVNNLFSRNHRLSYIDLSGCGIKNIPLGLPWATRRLQLGNNNITRIRKTALFGTRYLSILILDENKITRIDKKVFTRSRNLDQLWLNSNLLKKIPSPLPSKLTKLFMAKNRVAKLSPKDVSTTPVLTTLVLNSNLITSIAPNTFKQMKFLKTLNLKGNKLTILQSNLFAQLGKLETLSINNNKFITIEDGAFNGLVSLTNLEMAFIVDIDTDVQGNLFGAMPNLHFLDVQLSPSIAEQMLESDSMMASLGNLTRLNLMDNDLTSLAQNMQTHLSHVQVVKLAGNRWHCDQRLQWLSAWMRARRKVVFMKGSVQCHTPTSLQGRPIWLLEPGQFALVTSTAAPAISTLPGGAGSPVADGADRTARPGATTSKRPPQVKIPRERTVMRTQRFMVFPRTTPQNPSRSSRTATVKRKRPTILTLISTESTVATKRSSKPQLRSFVTAASTKHTPKNTAFMFPTSSEHDNSKIPNLPDHVGSWIPNTNHSKGNNSYTVDPAENETEAVSSSGMTATTTMVVSTCVGAALVLGIIAVAIFVAIRIRENKLVYHRALQYRQDYSDVFFFVGEPVRDMIDTKLRIAKSRSDRGSTSSRPSEDITNDLDNSMKVYTLCDE